MLVTVICSFSHIVSNAFLAKIVSQTTNCSSSKLKEFADDNFRFDENSRKFLKRVENIVGKGEIAHYEQFLLFARCFQKTCIADMLKTRACLGKG